MTVMRSTTALLLAACAAGMSCSLLASPSLAPAQAGTPLPQSATTKASPIAAEAEGALEELSGTKAVGTKKNSPFSGAKERDADAHGDLKADRGRLWWLLLPFGLAAISYGALCSQEENEA